MKAAWPPFHPTKLIRISMSYGRRACPNEWQASA
jgi:hypothetical protein